MDDLYNGNRWEGVGVGCILIFYRAEIQIDLESLAGLLFLSVC